MNLYYPVKNPINPTNPFGQASPMYTNLKLKGHPGQDYESPTGTPLYAPCDGDVFFVKDNFHGDGLWIRYPNNAKPEYNIILYHMPEVGTPLATQYPFKVSTTPGVVTSIKAGQLLGYTDNSGFPIESTAPHLHVGIMPCDFTGEALNPDNGFNGCVDPTPFWNGLFAEDIGKPIPPLPAPLPPNPTPIQESNWLTAVGNWLKKVAAYLNK